MTGNPKLDVTGKILHPGDIFIFPAGSPRYGGLRFDIGIVVSETDKRLKTISTKLVSKDGKKAKHTITTRTGSKLLKIQDPALYQLPVVLELKRIEEEILSKRES
tara:strand:- start:124 stop:438 length:315 start_codon:yes stop_codon:yes gene_type:complete